MAVAVSARSLRSVQIAVSLYVARQRRHAQRGGKPNLKASPTHILPLPSLGGGRTAIVWVTLSVFGL